MGGKEPPQRTHDGGDVPCAGVLCCANGPDRFIGDNEPGRQGPVTANRLGDLLMDKRGRAACPGRAPLIPGFLADAQQRRDAGVVGRPDLPGDHRVVFAEVPPPFGMADLHESDPQLRQERRRHLTCPRAVRPAAVLGAEQKR